jgi:hypothetical protein
LNSADSDDLSRRRKAWGDNKRIEKEEKTFFSFVEETDNIYFEDSRIILFCVLLIENIADKNNHLSVSNFFA